MNMVGLYWLQGSLETSMKQKGLECVWSNYHETVVLSIRVVACVVAKGNVRLNSQ